MAFLATALLFWPTLVSFPSMWAGDGFSHGWVIAALTGWLIWRHRGELLPSAHPAGVPFLAAIVGLSLVWLAATVANLRVVHQAVLVALLTCWCLAVFGRRAARVVVPIAATFLLATPIWAALVPILRPLTVLASGGLLWLLRVPAEIEGDFISIQAGTFLVEDGCAGLNYLLGGLVVGVFYAHLLLTGWRARLAVVGLIAAISIVGNWIRVTTLVVIGHVSQMESSLIDNHLWIGWVIFTVGLVPFFLLARRIESWDAASKVRGRSSSVSAAGSERQDAEVASAGFEPFRRVTVASALAAVGPALYLGLGALPRPDVPEWSSVRDAGDGWRQEESFARPYTWEPAYRGADEHRTVAYASPEATVYVDRLIFRAQTHGAELIQYDNRIAMREALLREGVVGQIGPERRWVRQAIVLAPEGPVLVWYWFRVGGIETSSPVRAKLLEVVAFFRRSPGAELVAVSAPCDAESCGRAFDALQAFMAGPMRR